MYERQPLATGDSCTPELVRSLPGNLCWGIKSFCALSLHHPSSLCTAGHAVIRWPRVPSCAITANSQRLRRALASHGWCRFQGRQDPAALNDTLSQLFRCCSRDDNGNSGAVQRSGTSSVRVHFLHIPCGTERAADDRNGLGDKHQPTAPLRTGKDSSAPHKSCDILAFRWTST